MSQRNSVVAWCNENREMTIEFLRIYLGLVLMIKGIMFALNPEHAAQFMTMVTIPFFEFLSIHIVSVTHIAGGLLMAIGLITRIAAIIQIPNLIGAIFFVHLHQGLFDKNQDLEYVILVLFLLLIFSIYGGGRLSIDYLLDKRGENKS